MEMKNNISHFTVLPKRDTETDFMLHPISRHKSKTPMFLEFLFLSQNS